MPLRDQPWPGIRQDTTNLGEGIVDILNVKYKVQGELQRRPGLGARYTLSATQLAFLESSAGKHLVAKDGTAINSLNMDTAATTAIKTGMNAARGTFALANGALYYANGSDNVQAIYAGNVASVDAGIVAPASAPTAGATAAGTITAGVHLIRFRWKNSVTGYFSNPSPSLSFTAAGAENCPLTLGTTLDAKVDKMVIEMTEAAGSTFYVVATVADSGSYTISISDALLNQNELADTYSAPDGFGHEPPPATLKTIMSSRNRMFGLDASGTLYWSRAAYPEAFNALEWSQKVFSNGGDKAIALANFMSDVYIFGQRSMARLVYSGDPASGMFAQIPTSFGVWNQNCVVDVEGALWGWGRQGIFKITEIQPRYMSAPVSETLNGDPDFSASADFFAFYDPQERVIWFMFKQTGDTGVRNGVAYDLQTKQWMRRSFRHIVNHGIVAGDSTRDDFVYIADDNGGYCWRLTDGSFDGVPSTMTSGVVTADVGATTSVIPVTETLGDVVGAIVYNPDTDEERRISVNTVNSFTVSSAFSAAPSSGAELWIGSIPVSLRSQWVPVHYIYAGRRPENMELLHLSDTQGVEFEVRYYTDYGTSPMIWTRTADDAPMSGQTIVNGQDYMTQDVSHGKNHVPVMADYMLALQYKLDQNRPMGTMRLLNASFTWNDQKGAQDIGH